MNRVKSTGVSAACAAALLSMGAASADSIGQIKLVEGSAMISQGAQYVPAREGMQLQELDRILVMENSSATLSFNDGCEYRMSDSEMLTLGAQSLCGKQATDPAAPSLAAIEQGATSQLGRVGAQSAWIWLLGGGAVAGGAWAASNGLGSDDRRPATPRPPLSPQ